MAAWPVHCFLVAVAAVVSLLARALAAAGVPPDGYIDGNKVWE